MEMAVVDADQAMTEIEELFAKDSWTESDCDVLFRRLFQLESGAEKFRTLAGRVMGENPDPTGTAAVKVGIIEYMMGRLDDALVTLVKGTDNRDRRWFQGLCYRKLEQYDKAIEEFERARERGFDEDRISLQIAQCQCLNGDTDAAAKAASKMASLSDNCEYHVLRGLVAEAAGEYDQAEEAYGEALDIDNDNPSAAFRLAFLYDMHGDEDQAIELYEQCLKTPPVNANAAINLAVLYEDAAQWDQADNCLRMVLSINPNHPRAKLFAKDVASSRTMFYDEELERRNVQRNAVLDIPVTDFELSVRARNCLKKMDIHTLGDLLKVTEQDLLGSKNFGETSLVEIKSMLSQKGLQLGQDVEPKPTLSIPGSESSGAVVGNEGVLSTPVAELELSVRARKALERLGIATLGDLASRGESELLTCKNFGQTSLNEIKQRLTEYGLELRK